MQRRHKSILFSTSETIAPFVFASKSSSSDEFLPYASSEILKDRKPVGELIEQLLESHWEIRQSQSELLRLVTEHDQKSAQKTDIQTLKHCNAELMEEIKKLQAYALSFSLRKHYSRITLIVVAFSFILLVFSILAGGQLVFSRNFFFFQLLASLLLFWLSSLIPETKR